MIVVKQNDTHFSPAMMRGEVGEVDYAYGSFVASDHESKLPVLVDITSLFGKILSDGIARIGLCVACPRPKFGIVLDAVYEFEVFRLESTEFN